MSLFPAVSRWKKEALTITRQEEKPTMLPGRGRQPSSHVNWQRSHKLCPHPSVHRPPAWSRDLTQSYFYWVQSWLGNAFLNVASAPCSQLAIQLPPSGEKNTVGELVYNENDWKEALHLITLLPWWSLFHSAARWVESTCLFPFTCDISSFLEPEVVMLGSLRISRAAQSRKPLLDHKRRDKGNS